MPQQGCFPRATHYTRVRICAPRCSFEAHQKIFEKLADLGRCRLGALLLLQAAPCGRGGSWPSRGGTSSIGSGPTGVPRRGEPLGVAAAAAAAAVRRDVLAAGGIPWFPAERRKPGVRARAAGGHKDAARGAAERVRAASRVGGAAAAIQACARGADWPRASALRGKALVSCSSKETPVRRYKA